MLKKVLRFVMGDDTNCQVSNKELFHYMVGVAGQNITYNLVSAWFFYYCSDVIYMDLMAIGVILGAARVWDAINDPLVGMFIDRHTFKNGEKMRPYLKWMPIPIGIMAMM
ncbi:MAG TPA: MFS transporter, partial [Clostridia bacterium]|nr:MFS transporter [Clostridia bacterium]